MKDFDVLTAEKDEIINIVCMYYARLSSEDIAYKTNKTKDLRYLAEHFNVKLTTINNYKDYYDARF